MKIILLDLNATLVENTEVHDLPFRYKVHLETYRSWLVQLIRPFYTIMMTARPEKHMEETLLRLSKLENWQPHEFYFKPSHSLTLAPKTKDIMLETFVFPRHGKYETHGTAYFAIESNSATRSMYRSHGIASYTQQQVLRAPHLVTG